MAEILKFLLKKKYIREFREEGLRFSSSMYLALIWVRVFQWVLDNPEEVSKKLSSGLPHFKKFSRSPSTDNYIEGLMESINALGISTMPSPSVSNEDSQIFLILVNRKRNHRGKKQKV